MSARIARIENRAANNAISAPPPRTTPWIIVQMLRLLNKSMSYPLFGPLQPMICAIPPKICQANAEGRDAFPDRPRAAPVRLFGMMMMSASAAGPTTATQTLEISVNLFKGNAFRIQFDESSVDSVTTDGPWLFGGDHGPAPSRLLAASVASCLASSLLHCLRKARVAIEDLSATVVLSEARNAQGRLRVERMSVLLNPQVAPEHIDRLSRCTTLFQDYCTVTESVRQGIDIRVTVAST